MKFVGEVEVRNGKRKWKWKTEMKLEVNERQTLQVGWDFVHRLMEWIWKWYYRQLGRLVCLNLHQILASIWDFCDELGTV